MKILFIAHADNYVYGAGKSLFLLMENLDADYDLIAEKPFLRYEDRDERHRLSTAVKERGRAGNVWLRRLPFSWCYVGEETRPWHMKALQVLRNLLWRATGGRRRLFALIRAGGYDVVHLNSVVLWPLISRVFPTVVHVRERLRSDGVQAARAKKAFSKARALILIGPEMAAPLAGVETVQCVLRNPIDMRGVLAVDAAAVKKEYGIPEGKTVFTIAGRITAEKGVPFVVGAFVRAQPENAVLFVPGVGVAAAVEKCRALAKNDPNVIFPGEIAEADKIYAVSDWVLRGEDFFALGRTAYEALYAGCGVLLPGERLRDLPAIEGHARFDAKINFFTPGDAGSLGEAFRTLWPCPKGAQAAEEMSTAAAYARQFEDICEQVAGEGKPAAERPE